VPIRAPPPEPELRRTRVPLSPCPSIPFRNIPFNIPPSMFF
jgi:hypothetical protein